MCVKREMLFLITVTNFTKLIKMLLVNIITTVNLTDVIQLTLTLKMTTEQVVKTSFIVNNHSPIFRTTFTRTITLNLYMYLVIHS